MWNDRRRRRAAVAPLGPGVLIAALGLGLLITARGAPLRADDGPPERFVDNPRPAAGDLEIPWPGGLTMVVRAIPVPGDINDIWGVDRSLTPFGNASDRTPFEIPHEALVGGSFPAAAAGGWVIVLGKYEVTKAQYAAVMGDGDIDRGLAELARLSADPEDGALAALAGIERWRALARPLTGLSWHEYQAFIDRANLWCFADRGCQQALASHQLSLAGVPGYWRLPTEAEWEYAVRGGDQAADFQGRLPVPEAELEDFAVAAGGRDRPRATPERIGRKDPLPHTGLHDMLGNVQEMVDGTFYLRPTGGRPGGRVARGGHYLDNLERLRSSLRTELDLYALQAGVMQPRRNLLTGLRLALGSQTLVDHRFQAEVEAQYRAAAEALGAIPTDALIGTMPAPASTAPAARDAPPAAGAEGAAAAAAVRHSGDDLLYIAEVARAVMGQGGAYAALADPMARVLASTDALRQDLRARSRDIVGLMALSATTSSQQYAQALSNGRRLRDAALQVRRRLDEERTPQREETLNTLGRYMISAEAEAQKAFGAYLQYLDEMSRYDAALVRETLLERVRQAGRGSALERIAATMLEDHMEDRLSGRRLPDAWRRQMNSEYARDELFQR